MDIIIMSLWKNCKSPKKLYYKISYVWTCCLSIFFSLSDNSFNMSYVNVYEVVCLFVCLCLYIMALKIDNKQGCDFVGMIVANVY